MKVLAGKGIIKTVDLGDGQDLLVQVLPRRKRQKYSLELADVDADTREGQQVILDWQDKVVAECLVGWHGIVDAKTGEEIPFSEKLLADEEFSLEPYEKIVPKILAAAGFPQADEGAPGADEVKNS